jgi:hypothetical protein
MKRFLAYILIAAFITACGCPEPAQAAQSAQSIQFLLSQVRNTSGPLAGGKVYAYAAGTSTAKTIWLNRSKSTVAANPYTLDANGTAALFGDGIYRIVIKTAAGVTVYDRDNLSFRDASGYVYNVSEFTPATLAGAVASLGSTPATLEYSTDQTLTANLSIPATLELAPLNGAKIIHGAYTIGGPGMANTGRWHRGQMFSGTGAVTGFTGDVIPQWFGAKGDGSTTDTPAIVKSMAAGGHLVFPPATYIHDGTFLTARSNMSITGYGATLKLKAGSYSSAVYFFGTTPVVNPVSGNPALDAETVNVAVKGITIDGNMGNVTTTNSSTGFWIYRGKKWAIEDVTVKDLPGTTGGGYGLIMSMSDGVTVSRSTFGRTDRSNIYVWETKNAVVDGSTFAGSYFRDCITAGGNDPQMFQRSGLKLTNSVLTNEYATSTHVLRLSGPVDAMLDNVELNARLDSPSGGTEGIYIVSAVPISLIANNVRINNAEYGILMETDAAHSLTLTNFEIGTKATVRNGIRTLSSGSTVKINNGVIKATVRPLYVAFAPRVNISNVDIDGGTTANSINAVAGGTFVFSNNTIENMTSATYSLLVGGDATAVPAITNNVCTGNTADAITGLYLGRFIDNDCTVTAARAKIVSNVYRTIYQSAAPTTGTWEVNDRTIRTPATVGQPKAWTCTVAGTAGTLNGGATTADTTATSDVIAVSSTTGLNVGDYITVAGIGGTTKKKVVSISSLNVTVDTAATNTVNDGAVSFVAPTFTSEGNL